MIAAEAPGAKLILVGRSGVPERYAWPDWQASRPETDPVSRRIHGLQTLEAAGAEVLVARADVADRGALREVLRQARERFGRLDGIVHAAGLVGASTSIRETTAAAVEKQLGPKVRGALALDALLSELPPAERPDFVILVSSLAAVLGGLGMAAYAAANRVLDALAEARQPHPDKTSGAPEGETAWLAVDWDAWRFGHPGAASAQTGAIGAVGAALARLAITPEEGREALARTFRFPDQPRVVVSTADLAARLGRWSGGPARDAAAQQSGAPRAAQLARPQLARAYAPPRTQLERTIAEVWQDALGFDQVGLHDDFFELGGDSLAAVHVTARLTELLRADLSPHSLLLHPTVAGLAATLAAAPAGPGAAAGHAAACLVPLQAGDRQRLRPLFLVHPVGGHVFFYERLARRLGGDRPVYGLRARGLEPNEEPQARLEEMAAAYLAELRAVEPAGPYLLGGSSLGGMVALEMAEQLRAAGEEVALLALLDTPGDGQMPRQPEDEADILAELLHGSLDVSARAAAARPGRAHPAGPRPGARSRRPAARPRRGARHPPAARGDHAFPGDVRLPAAALRRADGLLPGRPAPRHRSAPPRAALDRDRRRRPRGPRGAGRPHHHAPGDPRRRPRPPAQGVPQRAEMGGWGAVPAAAEPVLQD